MGSINPDTNTFSTQTEAAPTSTGETAEPGEISKPEQGATKSAPNGATASTTKSGDDVGRVRTPEHGPKKLKLTRKTVPLENGFLAWAPETWRSDLKPMIRYLVTDHDGSNIRIKYLTWDQPQDEKITLEDRRRPGNFFTTIRYLACEPLELRGGNQWNHATIAFVEDDNDDEDGEPIVEYEITQHTCIKLPKMSESAIWAEKPCVEWAGLRFKNIALRGTLSPYAHNHCGRLRVVTNEAIGDGKKEMVMKIWPTPTCSKFSLENEMMAYRACDGKGITPEFIGYVTEQGRHISMLTAYHSKAHKPENDEEKELCRTVLHTLQIETGWQRRALANHRDNFLIEDGRALLIDLSKADNPERIAKNGGEWAQKLLDEDFDRYWNWPSLVE
ncbi:hypothetical protein KVR01_004113 [Diaporthe batatas]|uniref:uncharacterized protein n=1 Tax=Diaporthe batatas TaxID=748121 RepID=UPI001D04320C|nr:uncharacterized protein KVR01_004113 [Diaporthe batatas]KAG8165561.1 hypothetical protein KVR01_004113 [Diaporthe batatas]